MPGGVCAVLDYEVEVMAEYIAEMAIRVVTPDSKVTAAFRKFVSQILSSTRLPSTTILLGMNYLAKRVNTIKSQGSFIASEGQVWRYLTVALLLGSKFLDDNTFQNKSWSDVSGIPVSELNQLELEWVVSMNWRLYINLDTQTDYHAWLDSWKQWLQIKQSKPLTPSSPERLTPQLLEVDFTKPRNGQTTMGTFHSTPSLEFNPFSLKRPVMSYRQSDSAAWPGNWHRNPHTPPESNFGTPDYALSATSVNKRYNEWYAAQTPYSRYPQSNYQSSYHSSRPPSHCSAANLSTGHGHAATPVDCTCHLNCDPNQQPAYYSNGYGTVIG